MDISGIGARMGAVLGMNPIQNVGNAGRSEQDTLQSANSVGMVAGESGKVNDTSEFGRKPVQGVDSTAISGSDMAKKAIADMKQDDDLEPFQIFVRSGETPEPQRFQEDWMRPVENFLL
ncbi:MAG: hypothetical protein IJV04_06790 [Lachnospiraceae bacterium]|nr:hypothetical protein [Lachnospiraceae bacterium]